MAANDSSYPQLVPNVLAALLVSARIHPERTAFQDRAGSVRLSWADVAAAVARVAGGLAERGVCRGDTVALLIGNRPEFAVIDAAVAALGAVPVSLYLTASPSQARHVIADTGARVVICDVATRRLVDAVAADFDDIE